MKKKRPKKIPSFIWNDQMIFLLQKMGGEGGGFVGIPKILHPGRLTAGTYSHHPFFPRKMIFQTCMIMFQPFIFRGAQPLPPTNFSTRWSSRKPPRWRVPEWPPAPWSRRSSPLVEGRRFRKGVVSKVRNNSRFGGTLGGLMIRDFLVGGFNPFEKYYSSQMILSPSRGENKKCLSFHHPVLV